MTSGPAEPEKPPAKRPAEAVLASVFRWFFFGVGLALLPILASGLAALTRDQPHFRVDSVLAGGELLLVASAIVGAALAELFYQTRPRFPILRLSTGGFSFLLIVAASLWFAEIAAERRDGTQLDDHFIAVGSLVVFGLSLLSGVSCLVLAELEASDDL